jgi:hypothetical protein
VAVIVGGLPVPERLITLIEAGRWPGPGDVIVHHEFLVSRSVLRPFCDPSSDYDYLHLYPPPV